MNTFKTTTKVKELTGTRKRDFRVIQTIQLCTDSYWSGGSRSEYKVINLDTKARFTPPAGSYPWTTRNDYILKPGDVVIETGSFCGKPASPRFHCLPSDYNRVVEWLGAKLTEAKEF